MKTICKKILFWYVILIAAFSLFNYAAAVLPKTNKYQKLIARSSRLLLKEQDYFEIGQNIIDNTTDSLILHVAYCMKTETPLSSSIRMTYYHSKRYPHNSHGVYSLNEVIEKGNGNMTEDSYWRYWFGQSALISLLHYFLELKKIFPLIGAITVFLVMSVSALVYKNYGAITVMAVFFLVALCNFQVFFHSLQFYPVFWIGFGGLLFYLVHPKCTREVFFFVLGMLCAYFDLLTVPVLTFGIPALFINMDDTLTHVKNNTANWKNWCYIWLIYPLFWGVGYALSWGTKILFGLFLTGDYQSLINQLLERSSSQCVGKYFSRWDVLPRNFMPLYDSVQVIFWLFVFFLISALIYKIILLNRGKVFFCKELFFGYCLMATYPMLIMLLTANHTFIHFWMTYRGMALSAACILLTLTAFRPRTIMLQTVK